MRVCYANLLHKYVLLENFTACYAFPLPACASRFLVAIGKKRNKKGGTEISFTMAIDFTASNGNPADPRSLHYVDPTGMILNDYAKAMSGIGRVLEFYGKGTWHARFLVPQQRVYRTHVL